MNIFCKKGGGDLTLTCKCKSSLQPHDLHYVIMLRLMIRFILCIRSIRLIGWGKFSKCIVKHDYHLILSPLFCECHPLWDFTLHLNHGWTWLNTWSYSETLHASKVVIIIKAFRIFLTTLYDIIFQWGSYMCNSDQKWCLLNIYI